MKANGTMVETLINSPLYLDYARAYTEATGLPVALRPVETWQLPLNGKRKENRFCSLLAGKSRSCAACLRMQETLAQGAKSGPNTVTCAYGLSETAVPVRLGDETLGFLQTGQVFQHKPTQAGFARVAPRLEESGLNKESLKEAWFATPVISRDKMNAAAGLLSIFAEHLAMKSNQIAVQQANAEPPAITRARQFILDHLTDELSLGKVAASVHMSVFYFCKQFRKVTGVNFTEFVSRARIEKARNLLLNPNLRVSEIAFEVGFQSLTHFNRMFKQIVGESPTEYRNRLPKAA
jgi:AraC-like DNA-binding protein/ligand-binding sensor protein